MTTNNNSTESSDSPKIQYVRPQNGFERHILNCCGAPEYELRPWIKKYLSKAGFTLIEDNYKVDRIKHDKRYERVHNLVAIRGKPNLCLVAHTDTCREHTEKQSSSTFSSITEWNDYEKFIGRRCSKEEYEKVKKAVFAEASHVAEYRVDPVIKQVSYKGQTRRIIQDRLNKFQVGGDDRLGVAIITWIALNSGYDLALYFPTDEEIGLKSASACEIKELREFDCVQVDRGNHSDELVVKIGSDILCSYEFGSRLLDIAYRLGMPRAVVSGMGTDVAALKRKGWIKNAVNMTCGYHNSHGADPDEYIDIVEADRTMKFVAEIVQDYYLKGPTV